MNSLRVTRCPFFWLTTSAPDPRSPTSAAGLPLLADTLDDDPAPLSELERVVVRELEAVGRLECVAGQIALVLARRIGSRRESGAATASLARQFSATMTKALAGVDRAADPLDEIRARRDLKRSAGRL